MNSSTNELDGFELLLRERLHELADHAPATVPAPGDLHLATPEPRRARRVAGIGATIAVIAGGVGLTTIGFQGAAEPGGADTPEAAVQEFAAALAAEDLLGMIDVALPEEVDALKAAVDEGTAQAQRLGLLDESFVASGVSGLDITVDQLALTTRSIDTDLVAVTATDGRLAATFDESSFRFGRLFDSVDIATSAGSANRDLAADPFTLVTLRRGGRWYVSFGVTLAESIRSGRGEPLPASMGILAEGSATAEAAATEFYRRLGNLDVAGAAALAAPGEGEVLRRYASLWLPPVRDALDGAAADGLTVALTGLHLRPIAESDGRVTLEPDEFVVEGTVPASWGGQSVEGPTRDPEVPTLIDSNDGRGVWILEPNEALAATVDELVGDPLPYESDEAQRVFTGMFNSTWVNGDGTIEPFVDAAPQPSTPQPFRVERRDGCTTASGSPFSDLVAFSPEAEQVDGSTARSCADNEFAGLVSSVFLLRGGATLLSLPTITVVENDGEWFVSPIGTLAGQLLDPLRALPDDTNVIDIPLLPYALGAQARDDLDRTFSLPAADLPPACASIAEPDGAGGLRTIADPAFADVLECSNSVWNPVDGDVSVSVGEGVAGESGVADGVVVSEPAVIDGVTTATILADNIVEVPASVPPGDAVEPVPTSSPATPSE